MERRGNIVLKGSVDRLSADGAVGWLYDAAADGRPVVRAFMHQELIGHAVADMYRPDLEQVGFGDGRCGFEIRFTRPVEPAGLPFVTLRPGHVDLDIPQTSRDSYVDLVQAILAQYAGAGRQRSILGGLWTDRTDAAPMLAGRVAVGSCSAELQPMLQELILHGYVVLHNVLAPSGLTRADAEMVAEAPWRGTEADGRAKAALSALSALLFREPLVRLLRAVFDDHPVVYRLDALHGAGRFGQACGIEPLPSPGECMALYVGHPAGPVRLDCLRDSHEMAELSPRGTSRWTLEGAHDLLAFAAASGLSVESLEVDAMDMVVVGPGMIHRVVAPQGAPGLRAFCAPRRVTPTRFLTGEEAWVEAGHVSGARIRV
jgi:hypothetical protein